MSNGTGKSYERDLYPCRKCPEALVCGKTRTCAQFHFFHKSIGASAASPRDSRNKIEQLS